MKGFLRQGEPLLADGRLAPNATDAHARALISRGF